MDKESSISRERASGLDGRPPGEREEFDHFCYFRLIDAFSEEGCPVCICLRRSACRYLDALFYESVNDVGVRAVLRRAEGFCNWHAWMAAEIPNSQLGIAIISEDLLGQALRRLRRTRFGPPGGGWMARLFWRLRPSGSRFLISASRGRKAPCPACALGRQAEASYLFGMLRFIEDPQFERAFDASAGLCLPHFLRLAEGYPSHPNLEIVARRSEQKWKELQDRLRRFAAKHSYTASEGFTEEESRSWRLAAEMLAGGRGVFANELHQAPPSSGRSAAAHVFPSRRPDPSLGNSGHPVDPRFEAEKLKLRVEELRSQLFEAASEASSLHYRYWQALEKIKELERDLTAARAGARMGELLVEKLRDEVACLKRQAGMNTQ